jgi:hypothetical protein
MMTKKALHSRPATPFATAFGMPLDDAIRRVFQSARELDDSANKVAKERDRHARNDFGQRITAAVRRKQSPCVFAAATGKNGDDDGDEDGDKEKNADNDFGQRIRASVQRRSRP